PSIAGSVPPYQYQWSNGAFNGSIAGVQAGDYQLEVTDANGCTYQETISLLQPPPILVQETTHTDTCDLAQGWAAIHASGGVPPYQLLWSESSNSDTIYDLMQGMYSYLLTDANACIKSGDILVENIPAPRASFDWGYPPLCAGQTIAHFKQTGDTENLVYAWNFGDGTQQSGTEVTHVYNEPGGYLVTMKVYNALGCMADTSAYIPVNPELTVFVPNAFTPDQDAINEGFAPVGEGMRSYEMYIFDRWGELIFETNEKLHTWNGSRQNTNESSKQEVYVYRVIAKGYCEEKEFIGHVVLLR
ncbi:MAG: PKD domain-containing protein, partial [Flavobacteriales bacterium]